MKAVLIQHGVGLPSRTDIEVNPGLIEGMYLRQTSPHSDLINAAYVYQLEHADKAYELLLRQYLAEQELRSKHAKEWNLLIPWRVR